MTRLEGPRLTLAVLGLLSLLVGLAYADSLTNGFVYDDNSIIVWNAQTKRLDHLPLLVASDYWAGLSDSRGGEGLRVESSLYRPLVLLTYALQYRLHGLDPRGFHLVNVLLHLGVTWLVYLVAIQLGFSPASGVVAAAIFAVHPLHTEAVTGIVGRAELLMTAGVLAGLRWAMQERRWLSLLAFAGGLGSKEQAVMLPAVLLLYDICKGGAEGAGGKGTAWLGLIRTGFARYGGYVLVLAAYLLIRWEVLGTLTLKQPPFLDNPLAHLEWYPRVLTAIKVAGQYLWLCVWPASLSADYSYNAIPAATSVMEPKVFSALLAWGSLLGSAAWSFFRGGRRACFCVGLTVLFFLPTSNLVVPIGTIMAERLFYLPSAGLCLLVGWAGERVFRWVRGNTAPDCPLRLAAGVTACALFVLVCVAFTLRTVSRNQDWASNDTLFQSALQVMPHSAKVHFLVGGEAMHKSEWERALQEYRTALSLYSSYSMVSPDLNARIGTILLKQDKPAEAIEPLERAVQLDPRFPAAYYNLGLAYARLGRYEEAQTAYRRVLALKPEHPESYNSLSYALAKQGRYEEALAMAEAALQRRAEFLEAHYNRARALEGLERFEAAAAGYEHVLALDPTQEGVRRKLTSLRARRGPSALLRPRTSHGEAGTSPQEY